MFRKSMAIIMAGVMLSLLCACNSAQQSTSQISERSRELYYYKSYDEDMPDIDIEEDMDGDGDKEKIHISIDGVDSSSEISASITVDNATTGDFLRGKEAYGIWAVHLVDLNLNDNAKEIAVMSDTVSNDPIIQIFRYKNGGVTAMPFRLYDKYEGKYETQYHMNLGYADDYPFFVNDDNSFVLQVQTGSVGMWDVYAKYREENGQIVRVEQEVYEVVNTIDYAEDAEGYISVDKDLLGRGLNLYRGDMIRVKYDNCNNYILIEKKNGEEGWFLIDEYNYSSGEYSRLFAMAG